MGKKSYSKSYSFFPYHLLGLMYLINMNESYYMSAVRPQYITLKR